MPLVMPNTAFNGCDEFRQYMMVGTGDPRTLILRGEPAGSTVRMEDPAIAFVEFVDTAKRIEPGASQLTPGDRLVFIRGVKAGETRLLVANGKGTRIAWTIRVVDLKVRTLACIAIRGPKTTYTYSEAQARLDIEAASNILLAQANIILWMDTFRKVIKDGFEVGFYPEEGIPSFTRQFRRQNRRMDRLDVNPSTYRTLFLLKKILGGDAGGYAGLGDRSMKVSVNYPASIPKAIVHEFVHTHGRHHTGYDPKTLPAGAALMYGDGSPAGIQAGTFLTRFELEALHAE